MPEAGERDPAGSVLRCVALTPIPCSQEVAIAQSISRIRLGVVRVVKRGWTNAPYKKPKAVAGKPAPAKTTDKDVDTKPLFEECLYQGREGLRVYNYSRVASVSDKGPRSEESVGVLCPGQTLTFSMKSEYVFKEHTFPKDKEVIEAYTMVDLTVSPSAVAQDPASGGYGIKLAKIREHDSSLFSYLGELGKAFPGSLEAAQGFVRGMLEEKTTGDTIRNCLENKAPLYFVPGAKVSRAAFTTSIRADLEFFRVQASPTLSKCLGLGF